MANRKTHQGIFVLAGLLLLLGSCTGPSTNNPPPTVTQTEYPSTPTKTQTMIPTETATPSFDYLQLDTLESGEYLVFLDNPANSSYDDIFLSLASASGEYAGVLAKVDTTVVSISPNIKWVTELPQILEIETGKATYYEELKDCSEPPSWAPDSQRFVASCMKNDEINLYVFALDNRSLLQITDFGEDFSGRMPSWSPDGKWIAYYKSSNRSGEYEQEGLHVIDVECFSSASTCADDNAGISVMFPYVWSPDSKYIASKGFDETQGVNSIEIFSVTNGALSLTEIFPVVQPFTWFSWAPSQTIAIDVEGATLILSTETGKFSEIEYLPFLFWIEVYQVQKY